MSPEQLADAVRLVEDTIDATCVFVATANRADRVAIPCEHTGRAVVEALVELGWTPPAPPPPPACGQRYDNLVCEAPAGHVPVYGDVDTWHRAGAVRWCS